MALCRPVPPKQEVEIYESFKGGWWWKRGEKSFQSSHALNSHNCFPNIIRANYQQAIGGFFGPTAWFELGVAAPPACDRPESALYVVRGQWLGHKASRGSGATLPSLAWWSRVDDTGCGWALLMLVSPTLASLQVYLGCFISCMNSQTPLEILIQ